MAIDRATNLAKKKSNTRDIRKAFKTSVERNLNFA